MYGNIERCIYISFGYWDIFFGYTIDLVHCLMNKQIKWVHCIQPG